MIKVLSNTNSRFRRRLVGVASATALAGVACVGAVLSTTDAADAASTADISVVQHVSGGAKSGQTVDKVTVHNAGSVTAKSVQAVFLLKTTAHGFLLHSNTGVCQI